MVEIFKNGQMFCFGHYVMVLVAKLHRQSPLYIYSEHVPLFCLSCCLQGGLKTILVFVFVYGNMLNVCKKKHTYTHMYMYTQKNLMYM